MKLIKRVWVKSKNLFEIGSSLDTDSAWSLQKQEEAKPLLVLKKPNEHALVFMMEKRRGKPVSLVGEFFVSSEVLKELCSKLKKNLGVGGTCKDGWLEFQGECREKLKALLKKEGYRTKS